MTSRERDALVEEAASAFRPRSPDGTIRPHPAFLDLDPAGRAEAHGRALVTRALEAALDPEGLSTTARAILARL